MVFGEPYTTSTLNADLKIDPKVIDGYLGHYEGGADFFIPRASVIVEKRDSNLSLRSSVGAVSWLTPITESKFYERIFGASVTFVKDDKGKSITLDFRFFRRANFAPPGAKTKKWRREALSANIVKETR